MFDPDAHMPRINRGMVYLGACLMPKAVVRCDRLMPTRKVIEESVDLAYEIFNREFRKVPERMP